MENNQLWCSAYEAVWSYSSCKFSLSSWAPFIHLPSLSSTQAATHPLSLSRSVFLWTFGPQDPVGTSPIWPLALKNRWTTKHHTLAQAHKIHSWRQTSNRMCAHFVCTCVCVTAYLCLHRCCVESQSAEATASALRSLSGSQTSLRWGNCTLQHKQPISHSNASALLLLNPGTSLRGTALQHPHSFGKVLSFPPPPGFNLVFQSDEIFKSIVSRGHSAVAFVLTIAAFICWAATVMIP